MATFLMTPLQLVVQETIDPHDIWNLMENIQQLQDAYPICEKLIQYGIGVNTVAEGLTNMARISRVYSISLPERKTVNNLTSKEELTIAAQRSRGRSWRYDTPLRILENEVKPAFKEVDFGQETTAEIDRGIQALKDLLVSHGAVSLHIFSHKHLEGNSSEDMKMW